MSMPASELQDRLVRLLAEQTALEPGELRPQRTFGDLDIDSLAMVELIVRVEEDTGLEFPPDLPGIGRDTTLAAAARVLEELGRSPMGGGDPTGGRLPHVEG